MRISKDKIQKIKENILAVLYSKSPQAVFTSDIALEIARDEEFIKKLVLEMEKERLVFAVKKNNKGINMKMTDQFGSDAKLTNDLTKDKIKVVEES